MSSCRAISRALRRRKSISTSNRSSRFQCIFPPNDTYGHAAGDKLLEHCGRILRSVVRTEIDLMARIGGEEFAVLVPETDMAGTEKLAERIRDAIASSPLLTEGRAIAATASLGVTFWGVAESSIEPALKRADVALYESKRCGRNRVTCQGSTPPQPDPVVLRLPFKPDHLSEGLLLALGSAMLGGANTDGDGATSAADGDAAAAAR